MDYIEFDRNNQYQYRNLQQLFADYFTGLFENDPEVNFTNEQLAEIFQDFLEALNFEDSWVILANDEPGGQLAGFVIAHIDRPHKDWCKREGWGMIREIYVAPQFRGRGIGKQLIRAAEAAMKNFEPPGFYLTSDDSFEFWQKVGYADTGEIEEANNSRIFAKSC
ncbi:MAG: GNAT family N-acetyltransferase [Clostridiales bacterium]|jgi:ribosomal protein S18 acetylase RimI-like enzyme|nr:GNAT family N-acetyltransferase [Clostridiales bacterium]